MLNVLAWKDFFNQPESVCIVEKNKMHRQVPNLNSRFLLTLHFHPTTFNFGFVRFFQFLSYFWLCDYCIFFFTVSRYWSFIAFDLLNRGAAGHNYLPSRYLCCFIEFRGLSFASSLVGTTVSIWFMWSRLIHSLWSCPILLAL
jgi:hypothetical protein